MLPISQSTDYPNILVWLLLLPLIAMGTIGVIARRYERYVWIVANLFSISILLFSLNLLSLFQADAPGFQFFFNKTLSQSLGIHLALGLDGLGIWCIIFSAVVMCLAVFRAKDITPGIAGYLALLFLAEEAVMGIFLSLDLVLFYGFWELLLIPNFLLLYKWGQHYNRRAAIKLALFTAVGSLLMLVSIAWLGQLASFDRLSFYLGDLIGLSFSVETGNYLLVGFLAAFFLKSAVFPFHSWLPDAHRSAPPGGSYDLTLVLPKVGLFGAMRILFLLLPDTLADNQRILVTIGLVALFYGALVAWKEKDLKRFLAFSTVSHVGLSVAALVSLTVEGMSGCLFLMIGSAISTGSLFILVSEMEKLYGVKYVEDLGGLARAVPVISALFLVFGLSSIGLPLTNGFVGEIYAIAGLLKADALYGIIAATGVVTSAMYFLSIYRQVFFGELTLQLSGKKVHALSLGLSLVPAVVIVFLLGLYPGPILSGVRQSAATLGAASEAAAHVLHLSANEIKSEKTSLFYSGERLLQRDTESPLILTENLNSF